MKPYSTNIGMTADEKPAGTTQALQERAEGVERAVEASAGAWMLCGVVLGVLLSPWWLLFAVAVAGFLIRHAIGGWPSPGFLDGRGKGKAVEKLTMKATEEDRG